MQLLCIGDLHLGREPAHSSPVVSELGSADEIAPRAAWKRCVDYAIEHAVDAVVLTGDLVEDPSDFFEAYGDLSRGIELLREHGIAIVAVAGNHDYKILPALADAIDGLELLGEGGTWTSTVIAGDDARVELLGWSFVGLQAPSPLRDPSDLPARVETGVPRIGVLHCDRDGSSPAYAPVRTTTLASAPVDAWLLGHIHKPDPLAGAAPNGYLGSVVGLDPSESGAHGPWLLQVGSDGAMSMEQVLLAPLRWETLAVDVSDLPDPDAIRGRLLEALGELDTRIHADVVMRARAVGVRVRFTGETDYRTQLIERLRADAPEQNPVPVGGSTYFVDDWSMEARPAVDLEQRAKGDDPVGQLARRLLALDEPDSDACQALVAGAQPHLQALARAPRCAPLEREPVDEAATRQYLKEAGLRALDQLIEQEALAR